jgi:DNA mismatch repair ATPase MutL
MEEKLMKTCTKCKIEKPLNEFHNKKSSKDGKNSRCKKCRNESNREYSKFNSNKIKKKREENKEYYSEYSKRYYENNKEKIKKKSKKWQSENKEHRKEYLRKYSEENRESLREKKRDYVNKDKDRWREYYRERKARKMKEDPLFNLEVSLRKRTHVAFKRTEWVKGSSNESMLGCTFEEAKEHIESKFTEGMSWDNHTVDGWHIDHIVPLCSATTQEELEELCHYTNLQPLWAFDNLSKGGR